MAEHKLNAELEALHAALIPVLAGMITNKIGVAKMLLDDPKLTAMTSSRSTTGKAVSSRRLPQALTVPSSPLCPSNSLQRKETNSK